LSIKIFYDNTNYKYPGWRKTVKLLEKVIRNERMVLGDLNFIITTDSILKKVNQEFLKHNYNTDVISFDYSVGGTVNGEIYISKDTVKRNAHNYRVSLSKEMLRVMIHGILHLTGYNDNTVEEKALMRKMEDMWLTVIEE